MARGVNTKANGIDFRANRFDEFLKLIPQNLSDAEKAQVMANLGITPTPGSLDGAVRYDVAQTLTDEQKQQAQENAGVAEALAGKANKDGYYSQLTAGAAESIIGGNETSREFTRDTAGGSADIADGIVRIEKIKGNTIVWNQIQGKSNFSNYNLRGLTHTDGVLNMTFRTDIYYARYNHLSVNSKIHKNDILVFSFDVIDMKFENNGNKFSFCFYSGSNQIFSNFIVEQTGRITRRVKITKDIDTSYALRGHIAIPATTKFTLNDYLKISDKFTIYNLTTMFGAGNEPATVAEFKKMFPLDYYDYNGGQLLSLNPSGILTDGFNQYNHANPVIKVFPKQYYIGGNYTSIWFSKYADDEEGSEITPVDNIFTPAEYGYIHVEGGNATNTVVNLHWSGKRDGEYEPYWQSTRNIDIASIKDSEGNTLFPDGLCSVGSVNDEVTSTKAIKRIAKQTINGAIGDEITLVGCNLSATEYKSVSDYGMLANGVLTLTAAVTNKDVLYELATPVEVTFAEPLSLTYSVSDYGTETLLPINTATPVTTPIRLDVVYGLNVVDFVRNADKNYLTIEDSTGDNGSSFTNLRSALSTAFGIDIVPTYDSTNKRYTFAISDNRKVEVPESATSNGTKGTWAEDTISVYFCTDTNTWVKINKETW